MEHDSQPTKEFFFKNQFKHSEIKKITSDTLQRELFHLD